MRIEQSSKSRALLNAWQTQAGNEWKLSYEQRQSEVSRYLDELSRYSSLGGRNLEVLRKQVLSFFDEAQVTGGENPAYLTAAAEEVETALHDIHQLLDITAPASVSIGLIQDRNCHASCFSDMEPPLIAFSSAMFDLFEDVAFFMSPPILRTLSLGVRLFDLNESETEFFVGLLQNHSLTTRTYAANTGEAILVTHHKYERWPLDFFHLSDLEFQLFFQLRELFREFSALHECAHLSLVREVGGQFGSSPNDKKSLEFACDALAVNISLQRRTAFSRSFDEPLNLTLLKFISPLILMRVFDFIERLAKLEASHAAFDVGSGSTQADYPTANERLDRMKQLTCLQLKEMFGGSAGNDAERLWNTLDYELTRVFGDLDLKNIVGSLGLRRGGAGAMAELLRKKYDES